MSAILAIIISQQAVWTERDYQNCACAGLEMEVQMPSGARADCISTTHAIEVESYSDWAEGIGQALHYGSETSKTPKLIMFCETTEAECFKQSLRLESTIANNDLKIDVVDAANLNCVPPS